MFKGHKICNCCIIRFLPIKLQSVVVTVTIRHVLCSNHLKVVLSSFGKSLSSKVSSHT